MLSDQMLGPIIEGVSNTSGTQFFNRITELLGHSVNADYCFIAIADTATMQATTLATYAGGKLIENFSYPLEHSPCEQVMCDRDSVYPTQVAELFPKDVLLTQMGIEGYIGASLKDSDNQLLGILVALFTQPIEEPDPIHTIFQLFSGRVAAEIARTQKADELELLNLQLEQRVKERTHELEQAMQELQLSQKRLIDQEKFASLGSLVAGVAHEVNTPLGVGITSASMIRATLEQLTAEVSNQSLTESAMNQALGELTQNTKILEQNLSRAARLVKNFKRVAVDNANLDRCRIDLNELVDAVLSSLHPETKKYPLQFEISIPPEICFESYPGDLTQLLTNLIINSLQHGLKTQQKGRISLDAKQQDNHLTLRYEDNGGGIEPDHLDKIFDPFFTTRRGQGGSGLGLNIVYNIVTQKLNGEISHYRPEQGGCGFSIRFPVNNH